MYYQSTPNQKKAAKKNPLKKRVFSKTQKGGFIF